MTPDSLYAALDEPNADIDLILGLIADWYEERGDCWRSECLQWCRREGKRPCKVVSQYGWWCSAVFAPRSSCVGEILWGHRNMFYTHENTAPCYQQLVDAWHALRTRGEVPVAGMDSERMVTT